MPGPSQPGAALVLRPSLRRYLRTSKVTVLLAAVLLAALLFRGGGFGVLVSVTVIAVASAVVPVYFRRAAIAVTADEVAVTGLLRTRRTPRASVAAVVTAGLPRSHKASKSLAHVFVLDGSGRRIARMTGSRWLEDDMRALIRELGLEPRKLGRVSSARELARSYPHAVRILERYPVIAGALVVVPALAIILAVSLELS
ncbi:hypothetical protein [Jiangella asiatica]|uniref:PH domain-containing protein n=1 Tax=Jiangella asiatica TaxID=2530372 RepID=A0A4R5CR44_9ACTN|nr:hypothetical protein [Jiangella asiatica]TDE00093.1 hypothetical protein E1269_26605 [Jiangella asiatica]